MPLTSLNPGNSRGLATRAKLVEAVLLKVTLLKNSDLPHSSRILCLSSQVLVQSLKGIDHLNMQCTWQRFGREIYKRSEAKRLSQSSELGSYIKLRKYQEFNCSFC